MCKYIQVRVVAAVIQSGDKFLACRRAPHKNLAGKWEFPGGKVEINETDTEALTREIKEELNVDVQVAELVAVSRGINGQQEIVMFSYFARLKSTKPTSSSDHDQLRWVSKAEIKSLDWADLDIPVIEALVKPEI
jgi:8-oxo-dGTP diphosphatase